ncbi:MAG: hypothetical protein ACI8YQ_002315 [Polaribacter sp.]|jgi:hypothetical protein
MKITSVFLKSLQQRLSVESRRGVHLNAIPGRSRLKFDLKQLALFQADLPTRFLEKLLTESSFEFSFANPLGTPLGSSAQLQSLCYEVEDIRAEKGIQTFGFGYPLVLFWDSKDKLIVAPLLIWSLQVSRTNREAEWLIERRTDDAVTVNEVLIRFLQKETKLVLDGTFDFIPEDGLVTASAIEGLFAYLSEKITSSGFVRTKKKKKPFTKVEALFSTDLQQIATRKELEQIEFDGLGMYRAGLFAVFEVRHQNLLRDYDGLLEEGETILDFEDLLGDPEMQLGAVKTDPSQQAILNALSVKRNLLIHGPPGTGKSQTLTAIIVNAITKGQKILVVCGKQTALQVIMEHLGKLELDRLAALIKEVKKDRRSIVNKVRQVVDEKSFYAGEGTLFATNEFEQELQRSRTLIDKVGEKRNFYAKKVWGDFVFGDLVALLLKIPDSFRKVPFVGGGLVDAKEVSQADWEGTKLLLQKGEELGGKATPFINGFNLERFAKDSSGLVKAEMEADIQKYQSRCLAIEQLNEKFEKNVQQFIFEKYDRIYQQLNQQLEEVRTCFRESISSASNKSDTLTQERLYGLRQYHQLCDFLAEEGGPDYEPRHTEEREEILEELAEIKISVKYWKQNWRTKIEEILRTIGTGGIYDELEELPIYNSLQKGIISLVKDFNGGEWFTEKVLLQNNVPESLALVQTRINELESLGNKGFLELHKWTTFFFAQADSIQKLMTTLSTETNWKERYSTFVLNGILEKQSLPDDIEGEEDRLLALHSNLEKHQVDFIQSYWRERQRINAIRFLQQQRIEVAQLYNKRSTAMAKKATLREIVEKDLDLFQSFFPVVLSTPETASLLFSQFGNQEIFDLVLFDEASQLKVEEGIPAFIKGKQKVIAGDEHQMPPSAYFGEKKTHDNKRNTNDLQEAPPSWLDFAMSLPVDHRYLDFHYRSCHPALIDFSNAAFYEDRLCPMPAEFEEPPIAFLEINGQYQEGLNEAEADEVVVLLQKMKRNTDGFFPSVGIATFNVKQRNFILEKIRKEEFQRPAFAAKMIELRESGLFVKNLENIQGDERDLLIISTVYGNDDNGKFSARFGPINLAGGYKLLNVLITRAKHRMVICCSIPEKVFKGYAKELQVNGNTRKGIFYAWLAYAKAVARKEDALRNQILSDLRKPQEKEKDKRSTIVRKALFPKMVYDQLLAEAKDGRLLLNTKLGGITVDILYEAPNGKRTIYICDGFNEEAILSSFGGKEEIELVWFWSEKQLGIKN